MPASLLRTISDNTAQGVVEGVELAAPIAREQVKKETKTLLRSKAAQRSGVITGGLLLVLIYGLIARHRRLERIEGKLDEVVDEVADEDDAEEPVDADKS
jgi:hypothetical protein